MARETRLKITADPSGFKRGVKEAEAAWKGFQNAVKEGIGLPSGGAEFGQMLANGLRVAAQAAADAVKSVADVSGALADASAATGATVAGLQELSYAGKLVGVSNEAIVSSLAKVNKEIGEGSSAFAKLGLSLQTLQSQSSDAAFKSIAASLASIKNETERAALGNEVFGKSYAQLAPLITSNMDAAAEAARRLGFVLGDETVAAGDALGDAMDTMSMAIEGAKQQMVAGLVESGALTAGVQALTDVVGAASQFFIANQDAIVGLASGGFDLARDSAIGLKTAMEAVSKVTGLTMAADLAGKFGEWALGADLAADAMSRLAFTMSGPLGQAARLGYRAQRAGFETYGGYAVGMGGALPSGGYQPSNVPEKAEAESESPDAMFERLYSARAQKALKEAGKRAGKQARIDFNDSLKEGLSEGGGPQSVVEMVARMLQEQSAKSNESLSGFLEQAFKLRKDSKLTIPINTLSAGASADFLGGSPAAPIKEAAEASRDWSAALADVANAFQVLGISSSSVLGSILGSIVSVGAALKGMNLKGGLMGGATGKAGVSNLLGNIAGGLQIAGAALSVGKAVFDLFTSSPVEKAAKAAGKIAGGKVSEGLAEAIAETSKSTGGNMQLASLLNISSIIGESGKDPRQFASQIGDLMNAVKLGAVPAAAGITEIGKAFNLVADAAMKAGTVGDAALTGMIKRARELGLDVPEIKAFVGGQLDSATGGLGGAVKGIKVTSAADMQAQATIASAVFWEVFAEKGLTAAAEAFAPIMETLQQSLASIGGDEASAAILGPIQQMVDLLGNDAFKGASDGAAGLAQTITGLANAAIPLTTSQFEAFGQQAMAAFEQAKQGALDTGATAEQATAAALTSVGPLIQAIIQASQAYGFELDANTASLIAQAQAAGAAFPSGPVDQMVAAVDRLVSAIERLLGLSGSTVNLGLNVPELPKGGGEGGGPGLPPKEPGFAKGGYVPATPGGQTIRVGEGNQGEYIIPEDDLRVALGGAPVINIDARGMDRRMITAAVRDALDRGTDSRLNAAIGRRARG